MHTLTAAVKVVTVAAATSYLAACSFGTSRSSSGEFSPESNVTTQQVTQQSSPMVGTEPIAVNDSNVYEVTSLTLKALLVTDSSVSVLNQSADATRENAGILGSASGVLIDIAPLQCQNGGYIKLQGEVTGGDGSNQTINFDNSLLWAISTQFNNCIQGANSISGSVTAHFDMNLTELLNSSQYAFSAFMNADNVMIVEQDQPAVVMSGDFSYTVENFDGVITRTKVITQNTSYLDGNGLQTLDYDLEKTFNNDNYRYSYEVSSVFTADFLDEQYVEYRTLIPLEGIGQAYPSSGKILIFGDTANIYVTALDDQNVLMELDENKDGRIDSVDYGNWEDLTLDVTQDIQIY